jgi:hypothetical protein
MAVLKLSQIAAAGAPPAATDQLVGVGSGPTDLLYSVSQLRSSVGPVIGTTPIVGGTSGRLLYDNSAVVGEAIVGTGLSLSGGTLNATGSGIAAGVTGSVQYNSGGSLFGDAQTGISGGGYTSYPTAAGAYLFTGAANGASGTGGIALYSDSSAGTIGTYNNFPLNFITNSAIGGYFDTAGSLHLVSNSGVGFYVKTGTNVGITFSSAPTLASVGSDGPLYFQLSGGNRFGYDANNIYTFYPVVSVINSPSGNLQTWQANAGSGTGKLATYSDATYGGIGTLTNNVLILFTNNFTGYAILNTSGAWQWAQYTTAGILVNDASGNVTTDSSVAAATVAAAFVADHRVAVNIAGTTYYISCSTTAW